MIDEFDMLVEAVATPTVIVSSRQWEPDLFFDGDRFMSFLDLHYNMIDVATYSFTKNTRCPLSKVGRLITGLKLAPGRLKAKESRFIPNNHTKIFLGYQGRSVVDVFVGSQNLTQGTNINLMYRVRARHVKPMIAFFDRMWYSKAK